MFDEIGRCVDPSGAHRTVVATTFLASCVVPLAVMLILLDPVHAVRPPEETAPPQEVFEPPPEVLIGDDPGGAPAAPPRGTPSLPTAATPRPSPTPEDEGDAKVSVAEPSSAMAPLEEPPCALCEPNGEVGTADGVPRGDTPGALGRGGDGTGAGTGDGDGDGDGPLLVPQGDLMPRVRPSPRYPPSARGLIAGKVVCEAALDLDERGRPSAIAVTGCPSTFEEATTEALWRWRWYPHRERGVARRVRTRVRVVFKP